MQDGSHFYRSVCDWDQNWIKQPKLFLRANQVINVASKLKNQRIETCGYNLTFDPLKSSNQELQKANNFLPIKILISVANASTGDT